MLQIKTLSPLEEVREFLINRASVSQVYEVDTHLEVDFQGDDEAVAGLLKALVEAGIEVLTFSEISNDLEEVFLRLTEGQTV